MDPIISSQITVDSTLKFNSVGKDADFRLEACANARLKIGLKVGAKLKGEVSLVLPIWLAGLISAHNLGALTFVILSGHAPDVRLWALICPYRPDTGAGQDPDPILTLFPSAVTQCQATVFEGPCFQQFQSEDIGEAA